MDKRKSVIALLAVAIVAIAATGGIYAYFSDVEEIQGNTYTAGTLNLTLGGAGAVPAHIGPVYPGWGTAAYPTSVGNKTTITVSNVGNINGVLWLNVTNQHNDDNGTVDPESSYNLVPGDGGDTTTGAGNGELQLNLYVKISYGTSVKLGPVLLSSIGSPTTLYLGTLAKGASNTVTIEYYVMTTVGNVIQSDWCEFDLVFNLEQDRTTAV